jgi:hypothetical protein
MSAYEVDGYRHDGTIFAVEVFECASDADALAIARELADGWGSVVKVFEKGNPNMTSVTSWILQPKDARAIHQGDRRSYL